ncbi:origin recognition complex subunit 3 N-terminus-domain-containing protein [Fimicolochytrium jonesii]|uniref:origin recognition complex subunit 3 N-terminus-domain-containing protein n=1 Tax=Fimicolochytrium jonesii TaxID=1396493 RepID=UPI0022FE0D04|nr:origin recognition complex subunit 3 N-terminus-domain-containing protein [Fimicolochytrium jonesii]KAI8820462.1 origin recognition complex subunit 3 N-terminus-domain-containing protein [Fimicolochytrium jonesii]
MTVLLDKISEGTFVIPARDGASAFGQDAATFKESEGFQRLFVNKERKDLCNLRQTACKKRWSAIKGAFNSILARLHADGVEDIVKFVRQPNEGGSDLYCGYRSARDACTQIPTGLILTGINTPDHEQQFSEVASKISALENFAVATLPATSCDSLSSTLKTMIAQLVGSGDDVDDEMAQVPRGSTGRARAKLPADDLQKLTGWHKRKGGNKTLVVILPDLEHFQPHILEDLVQILKEYISIIPFVFLLGVATSTETVRQMITERALGSLHMTTFRTRHSLECMNGVVEEIFIQRPSAADGMSVGFHLGEGPYKLMTDHFLLRTHSIGTFERTLKYAVMDFYYTNPLSVLLDVSQSEEDDTLVNKLGEEHLVRIRMLRSFRRYLDRLKEDDPGKAASILINDDELRSWLFECVALWDLYHLRYRAGLACIKALQATLGNPSFRKPIWALHKDGLSGDLLASPYLEGLLKVLLKQKVSKISECLNACLLTLTRDERTQEACENESDMLQVLIGDFEEVQAMQSNSGDEGDALQPPMKKRSLRSRDAPEAFKASVNAREEKLQEYTKVTRELFDNFFGECFRSYRELPLHEVFVYSNAKLLERAFHPQPRAAIQTALGHTTNYLNCACCPTSAGESAISHTLQDTSIVYRLYLECGSMINLYDWFMAFSAVLEKEVPPAAASAAESDENTPPASNRDDAQLRFFAAVAELEYLGFIKSTTRKTDHVVRLTWGNV